MDDKNKDNTNIAYTKEELLIEYKNEIEDIEKKIENSKNPKTINIAVNLDPSERDKFYKEMHKIATDKIINKFAKVGDLSNGHEHEHDFGEMKDNRVKQRIHKLENIKRYFERKILRLEKN